MSEIIEKTYNLLDVLDNSEVIKNLTYYKNKLLKNNNILSLIDSYNKEKNNSKKITIKKELYKNKDYNNYMKYYNELYYIVLKINKKYSEYTNTKKKESY